MTALTAELTKLITPNVMLVLFSAVIFGGVTLSAFAVMKAFSQRSALRRRLSGKESSVEKISAAAGNAIAYRRAASQVAERAKQHMAGADPTKMRKLQATLVQAGYYDKNAVFLFFAAQIAIAIALAVGAVLAAWLSMSDLNVNTLWLMVGVGGVLGYLLPRFYLHRRVKKRVQAHRCGFPDFLDLMVICTDAGLSMEASLDRISHEISDTHLSLSENLSISSVELRAGNSLNKTLDNLSSRLGLAEASSFATLIQQSVELGSSINEALRIYSEDMRHSRLSAAEEKAHGLSAKMSVPLTLCVLPVMMVVIILPIVVRLMEM